jgi:uncharacterized protein (TIGR02246 family)
MIRARRRYLTLSPALSTARIHWINIGRRIREIVMRSQFSTRGLVRALILFAALGVAGQHGAATAQAAAGAGATNRSADEQAIRAVIQAFLDTREKNDAAGLSALLTPDVDQQQTSGNVRKGRDAVVNGSLSTQRETGGTRTITVDSLRFVSDDVAIADGKYSSLGRADGTDQRMLTSMVLRRETGGWKIAAIRNSLPTAGR